MMKSDNEIIIIGPSHHNTLSMIRAFGEEGVNINLILYGSNDSYVSSSKYIQNLYVTVTSADALDKLETICSTSSKKPVVITCSDEISSLMDTMYERFCEKCYFFHAGSKGHITDYMDKQKQVELACSCGFLTPRSQQCYPSEVNFSLVKYPCFVKPKESIHGGKLLSVCNSEYELVKTLHSYNSEYEILVQDYIEKECEIVILGMTYKGQHLIPGFIQKFREFRGGTTYSTTHPIKEMDATIVAACEKIVSEIGYNGLWGIECIKNNKGYYFIELNMRNDATTFSIVKAGCNLPLVFYNSCCNISCNNESYNIRSINSIVEFQDFNFVLKRQVSLLKWLKQLWGSECRYFYSKDDILPYKLARKNYITFIVKRFFHL